MTLIFLKNIINKRIFNANFLQQVVLLFKYVHILIIITCVKCQKYLNKNDTDYVFTKMNVYLVQS